MGDDDAYIDDDEMYQETFPPNQNQDDKCPKNFGDYFDDFTETMKSSSKKLWNGAKTGNFDGEEVVKIFDSIKDTSKNVLSDMWNSGHDWSKTAKDIGKNVDAKIEKVLKKIPEIPKKIGPATKKERKKERKEGRKEGRKDGRKEGR